MSNPSKAKGTAAETALVNWARQNGFAQAQRLALTGTQDRGDIILCPGLIVEVKAHATWTDADIDAWLDETTNEAMNMTLWWNRDRNDPTDPSFRAFGGILVLRRPGKADPAKWWVIDWADPCYSTGVEIVGQYRLGEYFANLRDAGWGS